jgi:hypothetical protein
MAMPVTIVPILTIQANRIAMGMELEMYVKQLLLFQK